MRIRHLGLVTALLAVLNASLLASLVLIWRAGQMRVHAPQHLAAHSVSLPDLTIVAALPLVNVDIAAIRDNAVFHSRRSFYEPPPPSQSIPPPDYEFAGTMGLPQGKRIAFVKRKSDQSNRTLHVGEDLDGWRVDAIEASKVVLMRDDQRTELTPSVSPPVLGLVHGGSAPRVSQSGLRLLGASGAPSTYPLHAISTEARIYRPPPQEK